MLTNIPGMSKNKLYDSEGGMAKLFKEIYLTKQLRGGANNVR